jgi:hypothetical protein
MKNRCEAGGRVSNNAVSRLLLPIREVDDAHRNDLLKNYSRKSLREISDLGS